MRAFKLNFSWGYASQYSMGFYWTVTMCNIYHGVHGYLVTPRPTLVITLQAVNNIQHSILFIFPA